VWERRREHEHTPVEHNMATDNKYDRQLRLWGANGQAALSSANILLLGAGAAGTETLKNLVLPGVGSFSVVDPHVVTRADLGNNFFVTEDHIGELRAKVTSELLQELNPDVRGSYREGDVSSLLDAPDGAAYVTSHSLVVAANVPEAPLLRLAALLWDARVPLVVVRAYGLLGSVRLQLPEHTIVEARPDVEQPDLRLLEPFAELRDCADSFDLDALDSMEHSHVPYVVLLIKAMDAWRAAHDGEPPRTFAEKGAFRASVADMARGPDEENFAEAKRDAYRAYAARDVAPEVLEVTSHPRAATLTPESPPFWVLAAALRDFMAAHGGALPLAGSIPDMFSTTDAYIRVQRAYHTRAEADRGFMRRRAEELRVAAGCPEPVPEEDLEVFCRNAAVLRMVTTRSLAEERSSPERDTMAMAAAEPHEQDAALTPALWYLALRAADAFQTAEGRFPGSAVGAAGDLDGAQLEGDAAKVWAHLQGLAAEYGVGAGGAGDALGEKHAVEVTRYGASELHCIAAIAGGVAAQEAIKVVAHQFQPLNNTFLFNGICSAAFCGEL